MYPSIRDPILRIHRYEAYIPTLHIDSGEDRYEGAFKNNHRTLLQLEFHFDPGEDRYETQSKQKLKNLTTTRERANVNGSQVNIRTCMTD